MKLEEIGPAEKKSGRYSFGLYGIYSSAIRLMREGIDLSAHSYASEGGRESSRVLPYSIEDELGPLQLGVKIIL